MPYSEVTYARHGFNPVFGVMFDETCHNIHCGHIGIRMAYRWKERENGA